MQAKSENKSSNFDAASAFRYFDRVYVLNLPSRSDRRREIQEQLNSLGLDLNELPLELFPAARPSTKGDFDSVGARGCFLSHLAILRQAKLAAYERIAIFEDDLNFAPNFASRVSTIIDALALQKWHIFYGGYECENIYELAPGIPAIGVDQYVGCTHFIAFQQPAIEITEEFFQAMLTRSSGDPKGGPMHVDGAYGWMRRANPHLVTRLAVPPLGFQRASRTDIHPLRWFDRLPLSRALANKARKLANRVRSRP